LQLVEQPPLEDAVPHPVFGWQRAPCSQSPPTGGTEVGGQISTTQEPFWIA
jgi:hypothetical protein